MSGEHLKDLYVRPPNEFDVARETKQDSRTINVAELMVRRWQYLDAFVHNRREEYPLDRTFTDEMFVAWATQSKPEVTLFEYTEKWDKLRNDYAHGYYAWSPIEERRNQLTDIVVKLTEELVQKELAELGELPNLPLAQSGRLRVALSSFRKMFFTEMGLIQFADRAAEKLDMMLDPLVFVMLLGMFIALLLS